MYKLISAFFSIWFVVFNSAECFEYSISADPEVFRDELEAIQRCCGNDTFFAPELRTLPCKNAGPKAQSCLKEKVSQISSGALESRGEKLLRELPPVGRKFLIERCGMTGLVFSSLEQVNCARRSLTGGDDPSQEHFDFISAMANFSVETKTPLKVNFDETERAFKNYLHEYNAIAIIKHVCISTLSTGEDGFENCGGHRVNFHGSDVPFSPTPHVSKNDGARLEMLEAPSRLPSSFSGVESIDGPIRDQIEGEAEHKEQLQEKFLEEGVGGAFKCGETLLKVDEERPLCVDWKGDSNPLKVTTQTQLDRIGEFVFYQDLAAFAANKVWRSYALGAISDPSFSDMACPSENKNLRYDLVRRDLMGVLNQDFPSGGSKLSRCLTPKGLLDRGEFSNAVSAGVKVRCDNMSDGTGACSDSAVTLTKDEQRRKEVERFKKRYFQLKEIKSQLDKLRNGSLSIPGKKFGCSNRFKSCEKFFKHQEDCEKRFSKKEFNNGRALISGCISSNIMAEPEKSTYKMYENLKNLENYILSKNPALAARVENVDGEEKFFYETLDSVKSTNKAWNEIYDRGHEKSRKKSLDFLLGSICDDPKDFAEKMLLKNPALVNEFLQANNSLHLHKMMCHMKAHVNRKHQMNQAFQMGAIGATVILGFAAAIPTGGTSLAWGLGSAAAISGLGIAGHTLYAAKQNYQMETGMLHGCIGDFHRMQEADEAVDDAMIAAALELAIPIGIFSGMKLAQKIKRLSQIRAQSALRSGVDPTFGAHLEHAADIQNKITKGQQQLIAKSYQLGEDVSNDVLQTIYRLEQQGFSPTQIKEMIKRNCPL